MPIGALVVVPELQAEGVARLASRRTGYLTIKFLGTGAEMTQEERQVARYCLMPGTRVKAKLDGTERAGVIAPVAVKRDGPLLVYGWKHDGGEGPLREDAITAVEAPRDPFEQLATVAFNDNRPAFAKAGTALAPEPWGPRTWSAREDLLAWRDAAWSATGGVIGLAGARVRALPHQLLTARRALNDRRVRFLLADEVGLGKTIEAGLVVQSLLAARPDLRVLAIVPGALVSQWFLELFTRFGGRSFLMLDGERLRTFAGDPWSDRQFVIASSRAIEELDGKQGLAFAKSKWDVLIVDECHRMRPGGLLSKRVAVLSKATPHVLLLSATPARSHPDAYLALLKLLQPQAYQADDVASFKAKLAAHDQVVELLQRTLAADAAGMGAVARAWPEAVPGDPALAALAADAATGEPLPRDRLIGYVREHYQLDRRVIRHRRQVLARLSRETGVRAVDLTSRSRELVTYAADDAETAVRAALAAYRTTLLAAHAADGAVPPRLAHWLLQLELGAGAHPRVLDRLLAMRSAVLEQPKAFAEYRARAGAGETTAQVLRHDLSENEINSHIAISAACHADPAVEREALTALRAAIAEWMPRGDGATARLKALILRLKRFWKEFPQEKVLVFTAHSLAVEPLARVFAKSFGEDFVETFGAHQDTVTREDAARRFQDDDGCSLLVCDPLGGEGRNFQFVSVVAHHDLPWSIAAVEQRIGRVDRLGRDGDVPSWLVAPEGADAIDALWATALDRAVGVFERSSAGLEFVFDTVEGKALDAALSGGAPALAAALPELERLVAAERDSRDAREDECFHDDAAAYADAARLSEAVTTARPPIEALARWVRGMGGQAVREDEEPKPWRLRTRFADEPERGVFARDTALAHPRLSFFALGHDLIDRLVADADAAIWCRATAWRRPTRDGVKEWEGVRVVCQFVADLQPVAAAGLPLDALRRLYAFVPPKRLTAFVRCTDGAIEDDPTVLAVLATPFDAKAGDTTLSPGANRDAWTRLAIAGEVGKVVAWQDGVRRAAAGAAKWSAERSARERDLALAAIERPFAEALAAARATASAAVVRLGARHPEAARAGEEAAEEERQLAALRAAVEGGRLEIAAVAYVAVT